MNKLWGGQNASEPQAPLTEWFHPVPGRLSTYLARAMDRVFLHDKTVWVLVAVGWIARIGQYAANRRSEERRVGKECRL